MLLAAVFAPNPPKPGVWPKAGVDEAPKLNAITSVGDCMSVPEMTACVYVVTDLLAGAGGCTSQKAL